MGNTMIRLLLFFLLLCASTLVHAQKPQVKATATTAAENTGTVVAKSWPPSPSEGVTGYQLYEVTNGQRTAKGDPSLNPPIEITGVPFGKHTYAMTALRGSEESVLSETTDVTVGYPKLQPGGAPAMEQKFAVLGNISTRAYVQTGDKVEIGGFIIEGNTEKRVIVRGIGPSLPLTGSLQHPQVELHDANGILASNAGWKATQEKEITDSHLAPLNDSEAAIIAKLAPGPYTVILRDAQGGSGYGLVEVYDLDGGGTG